LVGGAADGLGTVGALGHLDGKVKGRADKAYRKTLEAHGIIEAIRKKVLYSSRILRRRIMAKI